MAGDSKEKSDDINVEELMKTVKARMDRKIAPPMVSDSLKPAGRLTIDEHPVLSQQAEENITYLLSNWRIENNQYKISSHRPLVGKLLVQGRHLVNGEVRRYIDPSIGRQDELNLRMAGILRELLVTTGELSIKTTELGENALTVADIERVANQVNAGPYNDLSSQISMFKTKTLEGLSRIKVDLEGRFSLDVNAINSDISVINSDVNAINSDISVINSDVNAIKSDIIALRKEQMEENDQTIDLNYFQFEERFRGTTVDISHRQYRFLEYFQGCKNVLDIGCGRGEFLGVLKENGVVGRGIDIDDHMLEYCQSLGLEVIKADAASYLETLDDNSLDGVFIDQVVEHLNSRYLIKLLKLCHDKLRSDSTLLIETVNPISFTSMANFFIDLTHIRPIHPETLKYLMSDAGFIDVQQQFLSPVTAEQRLKKMNPDMHGLTAGEICMIETYNENIEKLNSTIYGAQDYVVIGKK